MNAILFPYQSVNVANIWIKFLLCPVTKPSEFLLDLWLGMEASNIFVKKTSGKSFESTSRTGRVKSAPLKKSGQ